MRRLLNHAWWLALVVFVAIAFGGCFMKEPADVKECSQTKRAAVYIKNAATWVLVDACVGEGD